YYSEKTWRLPHVYWCYRQFEPSPDVAQLPAEASGQITFGCLNRFGKISEACVETWLDLLEAVPNSRLMIYPDPGAFIDPGTERFERRKLAADRLVIHRRNWSFEYLEQYHKIDIGLDPFPYCGGTTTCDAMWMGVPSVTLAGVLAVHRSGVTLLGNVGLSEF